MQVGLNHYSSVSTFEEEISRSGLADKILLLANQLAAKHSEGLIFHAQLVEEATTAVLGDDGSTLSIIKVHEILRYLLTNEFLFEIENCAAITYSRRQPSKQNSVYMIQKEEAKIRKLAFTPDRVDREESWRKWKKKQQQQQKKKRHSRMGSSLLKTESEEVQT